MRYFLGCVVICIIGALVVNGAVPAVRSELSQISCDVLPRSSCSSSRRAGVGSKDISVSLGYVERPKVYVTYGQSNAANTGAPGYSVQGSVFMFADGEIYPYRDPAIGATGEGASVWGRVGDLLSNELHGRPVIMVNTAWSGANLYDLTYGHQFDFFVKQFQAAILKVGTVDGVLFHQGESDHARYERPYDYEETFVDFFNRVQAIAPVDVFLAQATVCDSAADFKLQQAQNRLILKYERILRGPNADLISGDLHRLKDRCHFSSMGLDKLAIAWFEAIMAASEN